MSMSKVFSVKSNAVRHAVKLGMTREAAYKALDAVSGGWQFALPTAEFTEAHTGRPVEATVDVKVDAETSTDPTHAAANQESTALASQVPATVIQASAHVETEPEPTDAELSAGRAEHTITNGQPAIVVPDLTAESERIMHEVVAAVVKAPRKLQAEEPKAVKPAKAPKVAKPAKAPKAPRVKAPKATGTTKRGTPEYTHVMAARRKSQGRRGVTEATIALLRKKWVGAAELMAMNEWQSTTLRGVLSLEKKKQGFNLKSRKVDGATEYHIGS